MSACDRLSCLQSVGLRKRGNKGASGVVVSHHGCSARSERTSNTIPAPAASHPIREMAAGLSAPLTLMSAVSAYQSWCVWRARPRSDLEKQERSGQHLLQKWLWPSFCCSCKLQCWVLDAEECCFHPIFLPDCVSFRDEGKVNNLYCYFIAIWPLIVHFN